MAWSACLALAAVCIALMLPELPEILRLPASLAGFLSLVWLGAGYRFALILVPAAWALINAGWVMEDRLQPRLIGRDIQLTGQVCEFPKSGPRMHRFVLAVHSDAETADLPRRLYLSWYDPEERPRAGQTWQLTVRLKRPRGLSNPGGFDFERWAFTGRVGATGYIRAGHQNREIEPRPPICPLIAWRSRIASRVESSLHGHALTGYLLALSVGVRNGLLQEDWDLLRRTGTVHLMAISGLHVGFIALLMHGLGGLVGRMGVLAGASIDPLLIARSCSLLGGFLYSMMAGFAVSTTRAFVMLAVLVLLGFLRRRVAATKILGTAMFAVLLADPFAPLRPGMWLSFAAVGVILAFNIRIARGEKLERIPSILRWLGLLIALQLSLFIGLFPASAYFFSQISLVSPVGNLIAVPVFTFLIIPLTLIGTVGAMVSTGLGSIPLSFAADILEGLLGVLTRLDALPLSVWPVARIEFFWVPVLGILAMIIIWPSPVPWRWLAIVPIFLVLLTGSAAEPPLMRIVVMDVGHGLAVLVQTKQHALLYDAGPRYRSGDAGQAVVLPALNYFGIDRLDAVVVSHGDADHFGGVESVMKRFPDALLVATEKFGLSPRRYRRCHRDMQWSWDGVQFRFLHPGTDDSQRGWSDNDGSCVLRVKTGETSVLLPGDIEKRAEAHLVSHSTALQSNLVVAPHHGSETSSTQAFVRALRPDFVAFSTGYRNQWGFPRERVVDRWAATGAELLSTAANGAVVFEITGEGKLAIVGRLRFDDRRIWREFDDGPL
jgi:competence protein ComEC